MILKGFYNLNDSVTPFATEIITMEGVSHLKKNSSMKLFRSRNSLPYLSYSQLRHEVKGTNFSREVGISAASESPNCLALVEPPKNVAVSATEPGATSTDQTSKILLPSECDVKSHRELPPCSTAKTCQAPKAKAQRTGWICGGCTSRVCG